MQDKWLKRPRGWLLWRLLCLAIPGHGVAARRGGESTSGGGGDGAAAELGGDAPLNPLAILFVSLCLYVQHAARRLNAKLGFRSCEGGMHGSGAELTGLARTEHLEKLVYNLVACISHDFGDLAIAIAAAVDGKCSLA